MHACQFFYILGLDLDVLNGGDLDVLNGGAHNATHEATSRQRGKLTRAKASSGQSSLWSRPATGGRHATSG